MSEYLIEAGKIVNTHGIRGEVKIVPWCDSAEFLAGFDTLYIDGKPVRVRSARVHKSCVLAALEGVDDVSAAMRLKERVVSIDKRSAKLPEGRRFIADLLGLQVVDAETNQLYGTLADVLTLPANDVYVVRGEREYMIPVVPEFVKQVDVDARVIRVKIIPGMANDVK